jgi:hypothetical protein
MLFYVFMCGERAVSTKNCLWKKNELDNMRENEKESRRLMAEKRNGKFREEMRELSYYVMNERGSSRSV